MPPVKREVIPGAHSLAVVPNPFGDDPRSKALVIELPLEMERWVLPLNDEQVALLHDSTTPSGIITASPSDIPSPPAQL